MPIIINLGKLLFVICNSHLPRVPVAVHLGSNGVHDVLLALDALLPPLYLLNVLLALVISQLPIPLPEGSAVCPYL